MKIDLRFDPAWFYGDAKNIFAIEKIIQYIRENFDPECRILESTQFSFSLEVGKTKNSSDLASQLNDYLLETICLGVDPNAIPYQLTVNGENQQEKHIVPSNKNAPTRRENDVETMNRDAPEKDSARESSAMAIIENLVGAEDFKALCRNLQANAPELLQNGTAPLFRRTAYLFAASHGDGGEEVIPLFDRFLHEIGLLEGRMHPFFIPVMVDRGDRITLGEVSLESAYSNPRLVVLEISEVLDRTQDKYFKSILLNIFRKNKQCITVIQMPYSSQTMRERVLKDLRDILTVEPVLFPPLNETELRQISERELAKYAYNAEEEVWPLYQQKIEQESRDGCFYGVDTVRKITGEMILSTYRLPKEERVEKTVTVSALKELLRCDTIDEDPKGLEELDAMVGMSSVAAQIREMIRSVLFARSDVQGDIPAMHMVFTGNPGTGKTTVARIIGKALKDAGVLRIGHFVECEARDLIGQYVGHTAPKTRQFCERAYGSVLFIDEAYSLSSSDSGQDFGPEALAALIAEMENHRDDLVVIFAGYTKEMQQFLDVNPGLRSRIPYHIQFPNYTREELFLIFKGMVGSRFAYNPAILTKAENYFNSLPDELLNERTFGNGRFVRNLYEKLWSKAAMRLPETRPDELVLEVEDFDAVLREMNTPEEGVSKKLPRVGF